MMSEDVSIPQQEHNSPRLSPNASRAELLATLDLQERRQLLASLSEADFNGLEFDWGFWGRKNQFAPSSKNWSVWLILAGRGFGKTRSGAEWVRSLVCGSTPLAPGQVRHIALVAETAADARDVMVGDGKGPEEASGILQVHPKDFRPIYNSSLRRLTWPNGAIGSIYNATEPEQLRGPQHGAAWCFIAGTMVATLSGEVPIETLRAHTVVLTRKGSRKVIAARSREADVGRIEFSNGAELVGTPEHPVYTYRGWIRLDQLIVGDRVCVHDALAGTENFGIATAKAEAHITRELTSRLSQSELAAFMSKCGERLTAMCRMASKSITWTTTRPTTRFPTLNAWKKASIGRCTVNLIQFLKRIGVASPTYSCNAPTVAAYSFVGACPRTLDASDAPSSPLRIVARPNENACIAEKISEVGSEAFAASVVSTWRPAGRQQVFCLTVEGAPEYFANGILVHNCDELAKWRYAEETWDQLEFGLRLGNPRVCITTTPKPIKLLKAIIADPATVVTGGSTYENHNNLAQKFLDRVVRKYEGTRLGRQELAAEILEDVPGALWTRDLIEQGRIKNRQLVPNMQRVVVAIDPAASSTEKADESGIVCAGLGVDGRGYLLDDGSLRGKPIEWARKAIQLYRDHNCDRIVAEVNNGGEMVENTIRMVDATVPYRAVHASRGKVIRAEPISALYERKMISHVGAFPTLEDQLCGFTSDYDRKANGSPDRLDAMVWAFTDLMIRHVAETKTKTVVGMY